MKTMQEAGTDLHRSESNLYVNKLYNWRKQQQQEVRNNKLKQKNTHSQQEVVLVAARIPLGRSSTDGITQSS